MCYIVFGVSGKVFGKFKIVLPENHRKSLIYRHFCAFSYSIGFIVGIGWVELCPSLNYALSHSFSPQNTSFYYLSCSVKCCLMRGKWDCCAGNRLLYIHIYPNTTIVHQLTKKATISTPQIKAGSDSFPFLPYFLKEKMTGMSYSLFRLYLPTYRLTY